MLAEVSRAIPSFLAAVSRSPSIERDDFSPLTRIPVAVRAFGTSRVYSSCKTREINAWILNSNVETAEDGREGLDPTVERFDCRRSKGSYTFAGIHKWMGTVSGGPDGVRPRVEADPDMEAISPLKNGSDERNASVEDEDEDEEKSSANSSGLFETTASSSSPSSSPTGGATPTSGGNEDASASSKGSNKRRFEQGTSRTPSAKRSRGKYEWETIGQIHRYVGGIVESTPEIEGNSVAFKTRNKRSGEFRLPSPKRSRASLDLDNVASVSGSKGGNDIKDIVLPVIAAFAPDYKFPAAPTQTEEANEAVAEDNTPNGSEETIDLAIDEEYFKPKFATEPSRVRENDIPKSPILEEATASGQRPDRLIGRVISIVRECGVARWFTARSSSALDNNVVTTPPPSEPVVAQEIDPESDEDCFLSMFPAKASRVREHSVLPPPTPSKPEENQSAPIQGILCRPAMIEDDISYGFATKSSRVLDQNALTPPTPTKASTSPQKPDYKTDTLPRKNSTLPVFTAKMSYVPDYNVVSAPRIPSARRESTPIPTIVVTPEKNTIVPAFANMSSPIMDYNFMRPIAYSPLQRQDRNKSVFKLVTPSDKGRGIFTSSIPIDAVSRLQKSKQVFKLVSNRNEATLLPEFSTKSSRTPSYDLLSTPIPIISGKVMSPRRLNKTGCIPKIIITPPNDDSFQSPKISRVLDEHALATSISWRPTWNSQTRLKAVPVIIITSPDDENFQPPKSSRVLDYNALATYNLKRSSAQKEDRPIPTIVITAADEENTTPMFTMASPTLAEVESSCKSGNKPTVSKKMALNPKKENIVPMFTTKSSRALDVNILVSPPLSETGSSSNTGNKPILPKITLPPRRVNPLPMFTTKSSRVLNDNVLASPPLSGTGSNSDTGNKHTLPKKIISPLASKTLVPVPAIRESRILNQNILTPLSKSAANGVSPRRYTPTVIGKSIPKFGKSLPIFVAKSSRIVDENVLSLQKKKSKAGSVLASKPNIVRKTPISSIPKNIRPSIPRNMAPFTPKVKGKTVVETKTTNVRAKPAAAGNKPPPSSSTPPNKKRVIPTIAIAKGTSPRKYTPTVRKTTAPTALAGKKYASAFQREFSPVLPAEVILPATKTLRTTRQNSLLTTVEKKVTTAQKVTPAIEKFNSKSIKPTVVSRIKMRPMKLTLSLCPKEGRCLRASTSSFVPFSAEKTVGLIPKVLSVRLNRFRV